LHVVHPETILRLFCWQNGKEGSVLVFLPGLSSIHRMAEVLRHDAQFGRSERFVIIRLHSQLASATAGKEQRYLFTRPPSGVRKIVLSTNIAETGVTIRTSHTVLFLVSWCVVPCVRVSHTRSMEQRAADVVAVVDTGLAKQSNYDAGRRLRRLDQQLISRAAADQRTGRAGRVAPGLCVRLFSRERYESGMRAFTRPEMLRAPLQDIVLTILALSGSGRSDPRVMLQAALDPPRAEAVDTALEDLIDLGAVDVCGDGDERDGGVSSVFDGAAAAASSAARASRHRQGAEYILTPLGRTLARIPVDARLGKAILYGVFFNCADAVLIACAALSVRSSPFVSDDRRSSWSVADCELTTVYAAVSSYVRARDTKGLRFSDNHALRKWGLKGSVCREILALARQMWRAVMGGRGDDNRGVWVAPAELNQNSSRVAVIKLALCMGLAPSMCQRVSCLPSLYERMCVWKGS
jgi:HrpA-like RNA helicase